MTFKLADIIRIAYTWARINQEVDYGEYINSPEWKAKAQEAKKRAGYKCQLCNGTKRLDVHHRTYERLGHELDSDLTVLCHKCHSKHHGK